MASASRLMATPRERKPRSASSWTAAMTFLEMASLLWLIFRMTCGAPLATHIFFPSSQSRSAVARLSVGLKGSKWVSVYLAHSARREAGRDSQMQRSMASWLPISRREAREP